MSIRDLIPFNWGRDVTPRPTRAPARREPDRFGLTGWDDFDRVFENFFADWPAAANAPRVNVSENDKEYVVEAEMPGLDEKDIEVTFDHGQLQLRGERHQEHKDDTGRVHRMERTYGSFVRTLPLPVDVKVDKAKATYHQGVLTVTLPKDATRAPSKRIPVSTD